MPLATASIIDCLQAFCSETSTLCIPPSVHDALSRARRFVALQVCLRALKQHGRRIAGLACRAGGKQLRQAFYIFNEELFPNVVSSPVLHAVRSTPAVRAQKSIGRSRFGRSLNRRLLTVNLDNEATAESSR
jgi:hypothetical protein